MFYMSHILQLTHHNAMWFSERKYRIKHLDENIKTYYSGIATIFQVTVVPRKMHTIFGQKSEESGRKVSKATPKKGEE